MYLCNYVGHNKIKKKMFDKNDIVKNLTLINSLKNLIYEKNINATYENNFTERHFELNIFRLGTSN